MVTVGLQCTREFVLHFMRPKYRKAAFIAHNSKRFDGYIILSAMIDLRIKPFLIMQGSKVICIQDCDYHQKYIDLSLFLTMSLASMPRALGFNNKVKGFFPPSIQFRGEFKLCWPIPLSWILWSWSNEWEAEVGIWNLVQCCSSWEVWFSEKSYTLLLKWC